MYFKIAFSTLLRFGRFIYWNGGKSLWGANISQRPEYEKNKPFIYKGERIFQTERTANAKMCL